MFGAELSSTYVEGDGWFGTEGRKVEERTNARLEVKLQSRRFFDADSWNGGRPISTCNQAQHQTI